MTPPLRLGVRTPAGLLVDRPVQRVLAEDLSGWFGIRPGRLDLVAVLPPGLLAWGDGAEEGWVALSGGLLDLRRGECRVLARHAVASSQLEALADELARLLEERRARGAVQREVADDLAREALRRLAREARP